MTLSDSTLEYLAHRGIDKVKNFQRYLIVGKRVWQHLFTKTIYCVQSQWMPMKIGNPYNYVDLPIGTERLFSVTITDNCNKIIPLFYNNEVNVIPIPTTAKCGCSKCSCSGGLCDDISALTKTTRLLFSINGVDYYENTWVRVCPNGDIVLYKEIPTKKYNTYTGDGGDYNSDYNNDYLKNNPPFTDYSIVTEKFEQTLCSLEVEECGCPKNTASNEELFLQFCGCFLGDRNERKRRFCERYIGDVNSNNLGSVKLSDCGNKIFYIPNVRTHGLIPEFLLVNFQTNGIDCSSESEVPDFAFDCFSCGLDFFSKRFNNSFTEREKKAAEYIFSDAENKLILYLSPFSLESLGNVQDAVIRW